MATDLARNPDGLGVGALAEGQLEHGERGVVESLAQPPPAGGGMGGAPPAPRPQRTGPAPGSAVDLWGPTGRPEEPITSGMNDPGPAPMIADDPNMLLRALVQIDPHPDLVRLLNRG